MHFTMVNEKSTAGIFIDMIRVGNSPIILDAELKNLQKPTKKSSLWKAFFLETSVWKVPEPRRIIYNIAVEVCI